MEELLTLAQSIRDLSERVIGLERLFVTNLSFITQMGEIAQSFQDAMLEISDKNADANMLVINALKRYSAYMNNLESEYSGITISQLWLLQYIVHHVFQRVEKYIKPYSTCYSLSESLHILIDMFQFISDKGDTFSSSYGIYMDIFSRFLHVFNFDDDIYDSMYFFIDGLVHVYLGCLYSVKFISIVNE